jgi:hypothetical protein
MAKIEHIREAALLVRCSTDKQDYERQLEDLRIISERFGLHVKEPEHIYGEYITGKDDTTKQDRLSIIRLRSAAERKEFDVVLISEVSRMSRDSVSGRVYVRQFCNLGIPVYFRDKMKWTMNPDTLEEDESFIKELGLYFDGAAEYLKSMKTQIASGRRASLRNNQLVIGHVPFGYKKRGGTDRRHKSELIIDEETAPIVREIFSLYIQEGESLKTVSLAISAKYKIKKTVSGIQQVLARPEYYTGRYTVYMSDPDNKKKPSEPFTLTFDPLIDQATFEAAKAKREDKKSSRTPYPKQQVYPLTRLIKCPFCGHSFSPRARSGDNKGEKYRIINGKIAYSWLCCTRINNAGDCLSHINLNNEKLETILWDFIKEELLDFADPHKDNRHEKIALLEKEIREAESAIPKYMEEIANAKKRAKRAHTVYMDAVEVFPEEAQRNYLEELQKAKALQEDYTKEIDALKKQIQVKQNTIEYYRNSTITPQYLQSIENNMDGKRIIFKQLIETIEPYSLSPGVVVLDISTINGNYYILFDGNQRGEKRIAHYIAQPFIKWHPETKGKLQMYEPNSYFTLKNIDIFETFEELNLNHASFSDIQCLCALNGWVLPYNYIYKS